VSSTTISGRDPASGNFLAVDIDAGYVRDIRRAEATNDLWLSPGFIDIQVNGYKGYDLNSPTVDPDAVIAFTRELFAIGVTTFLPTLITASEAQIIKGLRAIAQARDIDEAVAQAIPFVHLEGPHIAVEDGARGAHPVEHVRAPSLDEFDRCQASSDVAIGLVTLSPHWPNAPEYIAGLVARGVRVAIGHTHATPDQIASAVHAGATLSTHLGNGIAGTLPRHPNPIWTQLADDRLWASFIADGHHLPADTLKVMLRAKGIERSILVSDSVALAGLPPGIYQASIGGQVELLDNGRLSIAGTNTLAGAGRSLKDDIAYLIRSGLTSLGDAVRMATINPGAFLGKPAALCTGARANFVQFRFEQESGQLEIHTVISGEKSWHVEDV
jgi:N-acetylglucosamine-6-phosphate deacetylase